MCVATRHSSYSRYTHLLKQEETYTHIRIHILIQGTPTQDSLTHATSPRSAAFPLYAPVEPLFLPVLYTTSQTPLLSSYQLDYRTIRPRLRAVPNRDSLCARSELSFVWSISLLRLRKQALLTLRT